MIELERIEAAAMRDAVVAGGGRAEHVGGAVCLAHPHVPISEMNRALPLGETVDLDAIARWYGELGTAYVVQVTPGRTELAGELAARGFTPGYGWMKFERGAEAAEPHETGLRVAESHDGETFGLAVAEGFGIPAAAAAIPAAIVGRPGWRCFVAWADGEPAAAAALFVDGTAGWLGIAATRPAFRGRGAQNALLRARMRRAAPTARRCSPPRPASASTAAPPAPTATSCAQASARRTCARTGRRRSSLSAGRSRPRSGRAPARRSRRC